MMLKKASSTTSSRVMQRTPLRCINGGGGARITRPVVRGATGNGGAGAAAADATSKSDLWRTTEGKELTRDEAASLARALAAAADGASTTQQQHQQLLRDGAAKRAADLVALEGAVLRAEQAYLNAAAGNGGAEADLAAANIKGVDAVVAVRQWQPIFASAGGFPRLLYIPVPEYFDVSAAASSGGKGAIDIVTEMGPVTTHFLGDCEWIPAGGGGGGGGSGGSASKLEYAISKCVVRVPAWRWFKLEFPFPLRNALAFFYYDAAAGVAAARSRLGGTMLMVAEPAGGAKYSLAGKGGGIREEGIERE